MLKLTTLDVKISDSITIGDFPKTGRGVKALVPIYKGKTVMEIGASSMVSPRFVIENYYQICDFVSSCFPPIRIDTFDLVVLWVLLESKNPLSKFKENRLVKRCCQESRKNSPFGVQELTNFLTENQPYIESLPGEISTPLCTPRAYWNLLPKQLQRAVDYDQNDLEGRFQGLWVTLFYYAEN